tara:strand:- start:756 stop:1625 length:870 start_codon:yes stop_codon:yes gene_type:complete
MFTVGIVADSHDWHTKQLSTYLEDKNCQVKTIDFNELFLKVSGENFEIFYRNEKINLSAVWVRYIGHGTLEQITTKLTILHLLEEQGIYVHNSPNVIEKTVDKARSSGILSVNKISSPETLVWSQCMKNYPRLKKTQNYLSKPIFGSQGKNIFLIKNNNNLYKFNPSGKIFYIQKFIGNLKLNRFHDFRVIISDHKVVSAMKRTSNKLVTNVYQGASFEKIKSSEGLNQISSNVSKIFRLGYGGIDIIEYKKKFFVIEINSIPSWKALQKVETKNITKILVDDFLRKAK